MSQYAIIAKDITHENICKITFLAPDIAQVARAGQFLHIRPGECSDPLLRRPISIHDADKDMGTVTILFKIIGKGTKIIAEKTAGDKLDVMGPLGNGYNFPDKGAALFIGVGIGLAPLLFAVRQAQQKGLEVIFSPGTGSAKKMLPYADFEQFASKVLPFSKDGSIGTQAFADTMIETILESTQLDYICTCGPEGMMKQVAKTAAQHGIPCQVSIEERMGCGVGACMTCVCATKKADGSIGHSRVCHDGPVFDGKEVFFDELG